MIKFLEFNIQLFAHKKGQSSTSNGRDSAGQSPRSWWSLPEGRSPLGERGSP